MTAFQRIIISEIGLSAVIAAAAVIGLPKLSDPAAPVNYPLAVIVFLACSAAFVGYELFARRS
ncbi:hypothetical protein GCM10010520_15520 [Rhizobium viscosum]|uniref:Integral membrane protein n=1 Tax=Rhizobium viscosum TaxID=1673 RepID=A0ABR9IXH4_RHIVS|nr:hypothetical protein [Rhizobium viscosum]MBE1507904.1 hypothetical protein [Rhizobium viscosum]